MTSPTITPWHPRESLRRADLAATRAVRQAWGDLFDGSRCAEALEGLLGARVDVHLVSVRHGPPTAPMDGGIAVELVGPDGGGREISIEVEPALAVTLAARALKRQPPRISAAPDEDDTVSLAGGLAAIATAVARHAPRGPLRARSAGNATAALARWRSEGRPSNTASVRVVLDDAAYEARVYVPACSTPGSGAPWSRDRLKALGETPLEVPVVACVCRVSADEVASLGVGDAWMLGRLAWERGPRGDVVLAAPDADWGARAELVETGALMLRPGRAELGGRDMSEKDESDPIVEAVGDVPVVVRVEVGTARMTAREWAALGPGDVVALARSVADPVILRVGGVEVARGELVDIEGEIGVRILRRIGERG